MVLAGFLSSSSISSAGRELLRFGPVATFFLSLLPNMFPNMLVFSLPVGALVATLFLALLSSFFSLVLSSCLSLRSAGLIWFGICSLTFCLSALSSLLYSGALQRLFSLTIIFDELSSLAAFSASPSRCAVESPSSVATSNLEAHLDG